MGRLLGVCCLMVALGGGVTAMGGCAARDDELVRLEEPGESPMRPVRPVDEEQPWSETAGEVIFVIVAVGLAIGAIVLPILLL
jgi:hypothetical protein